MQGDVCHYAAPNAGTGIFPSTDSYLTQDGHSAWVDSFAKILPPESLTCGPYPAMQAASLYAQPYFWGACQQDQLEAQLSQTQQIWNLMQLQMQLLLLSQSSYNQDFLSHSPLAGPPGEQCNTYQAGERCVTNDDFTSSDVTTCLRHFGDSCILAGEPNPGSFSNVVSVPSFHRVESPRDPILPREQGSFTDECAATALQRSQCTRPKSRRDHKTARTALNIPPQKSAPAEIGRQSEVNDLNSIQEQVGCAESFQTEIPGVGNRSIQDLQKMEQELIHITVGILTDPLLNPYQGSIPVERTQNICRSKYPLLYDLVVGSRHNSWRRFLERHSDVFGVLSVDDGKWRMRWLEHIDWQVCSEKTFCASITVCSVFKCLRQRCMLVSETPALPF